jgi:hypothetical protein
MWEMLSSIALASRMASAASFTTYPKRSTELNRFGLGSTVDLACDKGGGD